MMAETTHRRGTGEENHHVPDRVQETARGTSSFEEGPPSDGGRRPPGVADTSTSAWHRPLECSGEEHGTARVGTASSGFDRSGSGDDSVRGNVDGAADASSSTAGGEAGHADDAEADDGTVAIERESSAWDLLGERFELAASAGRYIDLTCDAGGDGDVGGRIDAATGAAMELSASEAAATFASAEAPVDPSSICGPTTPPHSHPAPSSGPLGKLGQMMTGTIDALGKLRSMLQAEIQALQSPTPTEKVDRRRRGLEKKKLHKAVVGIDGRTRRIAEFVRQNEGAVAECPAAMGRLEDLNLLVMKANALVAAVNKKAGKTAPTSKSNAAESASASTSSARPHGCEVWGRAFRSAGILESHRKLKGHLGVKSPDEERREPHRCAVCGKTFAIEKSLEQHRLTKGHLDANPPGASSNEGGGAGGERKRRRERKRKGSFPCPVCHMRLASSLNLENHMHFMHGIASGGGGGGGGGVSNPNRDGAGPSGIGGVKRERGGEESGEGVPFVVDTKRRSRDDRS